MSAKQLALVLLITASVSASAQLSDREKVAQLLIVGIDGRVPGDEVKALVSEWRVGGFALYAHNLGTNEEIKALTGALKRNGAFVAIDQEGGIVRRLDFGMPSAMAIGATRSPLLAKRAGAVVGARMGELGFDVNFAPVLDVLVNPGNDAIGTRAFGDDPKRVAELGAAYVEGLHATGIAAVGKHFPGGGAVGEDPHVTLPRLDVDRATLETRELVPFRAAKLDAVMIGHLALQPNLPASLSKDVLTTMLRGELHFEGVAIIDALQMRALPREGGPGKLAVDAIRAGADMVLTVGSRAERRAVLDALLAALQDGSLPRARVDEALARIARFKAKRERAKIERDDTISDHIARKSITRIGAIPNITRGDLLFVGDAPILRDALGAKNAIAIPPRGESWVVDIKERAKNARVVVAAVRDARELALVRTLPHLVLVQLGLPREAKLPILLTYSDAPASQRAAAEVLLGVRQSEGRVPLSGWHE